MFGQLVCTQLPCLLHNGVDGCLETAYILYGTMLDIVVETQAITHVPYLLLISLTIYINSNATSNHVSIPNNDEIKHKGMTYPGETTRLNYFKHCHDRKDTSLK